MLMTGYLKRLYPVFQVDFQRPVVISKVATQGAKQFLKHNYVLNYTISYSTDKRSGFSTKETVIPSERQVTISVWL